MGTSSYHSQIGRVEKEILDLEKKIYGEQKKILDKEKQIGSTNRSITKNTSLLTLKSKKDQIFRYQKDILNVLTKINDYEKQKRNKQIDLTKKKEALRKEELAEQKKQQQTLSKTTSSFGDREFAIDLETKDIEFEEDFMEDNLNEDGNSEVIPVFVSYSWDSKDHEKKVFDFVNFLRNNGFNADMDKGLSQQETSTNFLKMMYKAMHDYPKIVVVLSEGYKKKADAFTGGVGKEYELMISDLNDNPNKYILASFGGRNPSIIPSGLKGHDIVDLSDDEEKTRLFEKLLGHKRYIFAEVAKTKPKLPVQLADEFIAAKSAEVIDTNPFSIDYSLKEGDVSLFGDQYKFIDFTLKFIIGNRSGQTINGFNYNIKLPRELDIDHYYEADSDGFVIYQRSHDLRIFNTQSIQTDGFPIRVAHQHVRHLMDAKIKIEIFSDAGTVEESFQVADLIKIKPGNNHFNEAIPLSPELFVDR